MCEAYGHPSPIQHVLRPEMVAAGNVSMVTEIDRNTAGFIVQIGTNRNGMIESCEHLLLG